jgi:Ca2+-transporting ATPase
MKAAELWTTDGQAYGFTESPYSNPLNGKIITQPVPSLQAPSVFNKPVPVMPSRELSPTNISSQAPTMTLAMMVSALCNNASISHSDNVWNEIGDPTEVALLIAATKAGLSRAAWMSKGFSKVHEKSFDSERKLMSTVWKSSEGIEYVLCKGAPEEVLRKCTYFCKPTSKSNSIHSIVHGERIEAQIINENFIDEVSEESNSMAKEGLRVLGLAYRKVDITNALDIPSQEDDSHYDEADLTFIGLIGLIDPLKEGVKDAIARCQQAGIKVIMITGDHVQTATAIATQLGIVQPNSTCTVRVHIDYVATFFKFTNWLLNPKLGIRHDWKRVGSTI